MASMCSSSGFFCSWSNKSIRRKLPSLAAWLRLWVNISSSQWTFNRGKFSSHIGIPSHQFSSLLSSSQPTASLVPPVILTGYIIPVITTHFTAIIICARVLLSQLSKVQPRVRLSGCQLTTSFAFILFHMVCGHNNTLYLLISLLLWLNFTLKIDFFPFLFSRLGSLSCYIISFCFVVCWFYYYYCAISFLANQVSRLICLFSHFQH